MWHGWPNDKAKKNTAVHKLIAVTGENFSQNASRRKQVTNGDYGLLPDTIIRS